MNKYLVFFLVVSLLAGSRAIAQEQDKLHGAAKHHRSPDGQTSHKGKKHVAKEEQKAAPAKPVAVKPPKKEAAPKPAAKPVAVKHVAKQPTIKSAVVKHPAPAVTHIAAKQPVVKHAAKHPAVTHLAAKNKVAKHHPAVHHKKAHRAAAHPVVKRANPVINQENITLNEHKPTTEIEIKNGNVLINDSFVFKIKSLKNEDDKISITTTAPQVIQSNATEKPDNEKEEMEEPAEPSERAMLGVYSTDGSDGGAKIVSVVPGSPAYEAGLLQGDVITRLDDKEIDNSQSLVDAVRDSKAGERIMLTWWRYGKKEITCVVLSNAGEKEHGDHREMSQPHGYYKKFYHGRWR
jgi:hypothetical protein